jgi:hypothetical protein
MSEFPRNAISGLFVLVALLTACEPRSSGPGKEAAPMRLEALSARELVRLARSRAEDQLGHRGLLLYTPPLPSEWPISRATEILIFGYRSEPVPTGIIQSRISTPRVVVRMVVEAGGTPGSASDHTGSSRADGAEGSIIVRSVEVLEDRVLDGLQPRGEDAPSERDIHAAGDVLLRGMATGQIARGDAERVRDTYRRWRAANPVIAAHLVAAVPGFFGWLDTGT